MYSFDDVYNTMQGQLLPEYAVPGIENAFARGGTCAENYKNMLLAYMRLCERLGVGEFDDDVEIIINSLLDNQMELCRRMFELGRAGKL